MRPARVGARVEDGGRERRSLWTERPKPRRQEPAWEPLGKDLIKVPFVGRQEEVEAALAHVAKVLN